MYGLIPENPNPELQRTLIIVSKVIQSCANRTLPGDKEPYLIPMHDFISKKFFDKVEQFFNSISANNANSNPNGFEIEIRDSLKSNYLKALYKVFCSNAKYVRKFLEESNMNDKEKMEQFERILKL